MKLRRVAIAAVLTVVGLPLLLGLTGVILFYAVFYFANRTTATAETIVSSGATREYLLYVPRSYDRSRPTPLVVSMHPAMSWPSSQMSISHWNDVADENGILVVYPAGTGHGPRTWFMEGRRTPSRMPDVLFLSHLIDSLESSYNVDRARIYADGLSNGGGMAFAMACARPDRVAAVGMVSAARSLDWTGCADQQPVASIAFHGTADPVVPYGGGATPVGPDVFPSVPGFTAEWARRNRCHQNPIESAAAPDVTRLEYGRCAEDAAVVLFSISGGGHQWPGGRRLPEFLVGPYTAAVDATRLMWAFFRDHPRKTPPAPGGSGRPPAAPGGSGD
jgi:polyhydroxybutyrate depolymerase